MEKDERLLPLPKIGDLQPMQTSEPSGYAPIYDDEFDSKRSLREYFMVVYKRLPAILALTIITTAAVAFYMYRQPSVYMARTEMIIEPRKPKVQNKDAININFGNDLNYYNTQLQLLKNEELMRDVVIKLNLQREPNLFNNQTRGFFTTIGSMFSSEKNAQTKESSLPVLTDTGIDKNNQTALTPEESKRADEYAGILLGGLDVKRTELTNLVNLSVTNTNPVLAAKVADGVAEVFIEQDNDRETQGSKRSLADLSESIDKLRGTIDSKEAELINFMRDRNMPLQERGSELSASILQNLSNQWLSAIDDRRKIEARYQTAVKASQRGEGQSIPDLTENPIYRESVRINTENKAKLQDRIRDIDKQISDAETEKSKDSVKYTEANPIIQQWIAKIESLRQEREKTEKEFTKVIEQDQQKIERDAVSGALVGLRSQLDASQNRENQLRETYMREMASANVQGQAETRLTTLKRDIETSRNLLDTYTQQQKQLELSIASSAPDNLKISNHAVTPTAPTGPNRNRNIIIAFLISLTAGIGLAFLLDYLDDSLKSSDDVGRYLGLPTLALIPYSAASEKRRTLSLSNGNGNGNGMASVALIKPEDTRSDIAEAYRHLRTSLLFSSAGKPPQTILVTSSQPAEGKTTTAINTAITLAQSGADVVIIDCDLRRPRLHKHFGVTNSVGLTSYLSGEKNPDSLVKNCEGIANLKVITSGPIPPNPAELLSSNEMKNLLQFLKGNFKHIIIDSPPATFFTDATVLSMIVDGVVLVALAGKSSIHLTRRFKQRLSGIGARIYGVVLNGIRTNSLDYGYYGYGYASDYYIASKDDDDSTPLMEEEDVETMIRDLRRK